MWDLTCGFVSAPGRIRTCATSLGGRTSRCPGRSRAQPGHRSGVSSVPSCFARPQFVPRTAPRTMIASASARVSGGRRRCFEQSATTRVGADGESDAPTDVHDRHGLRGLAALVHDAMLPAPRRSIPVAPRGESAGPTGRSTSPIVRAQEHLLIRVPPGAQHRQRHRPRLLVTSAGQARGPAGRRCTAGG
jgi:hypothetical protein